VRQGRGPAKLVDASPAPAPLLLLVLLLILVLLLLLLIHPFLSKQQQESE